jgi:hypothetical protein
MKPNIKQFIGLSDDDSAAEMDWHRAFVEKDQECDSLKFALSSLSSVVREMNDEVRAKTIECDALHQTVTILSSSLRESDRQLQETAVHCEKLDMKLQAVCFLDRQEHRPEEEEEDGEIVCSKSVSSDGRKSKKSSKRNLQQRISVDDVVVLLAKDAALEERDENANTDDSSSEDADADTAAADNAPATSKTAKVVSTDAPCLTGPGQAAFYRVIYERDQATRELDRLTHEVQRRREQVQFFKEKLNKSNALIELSYGKASPKGNDARRPRSWLRKSKSNSHYVEDTGPPPGADAVYVEEFASGIDGPGGLREESSSLLIEL